MDKIPWKNLEKTLNFNLQKLWEPCHIVVRYASAVKSTGTIATLYEIRHVWLITLVAIVYVDLYFFFWTFIWIFACFCNSLSLISRLRCLSSAFFLRLAVRPLCVRQIDGRLSVKNRSTMKSLGLLHVPVCYPLTDRFRFVLLGERFLTNDGQATHRFLLKLIYSLKWNFAKMRKSIKF